MSKYITVGKTRLEKKLLKQYKYLQKIIQGGKLRGYRLYTTGHFNLPSFSRYYWLSKV